MGKGLCSQCKPDSSLGFRLFPSPSRGLHYHAFLEGIGGDPDVTDFAVDQSLDTLQVGHEPPLGDRSDVRADAALFLGFPTPPDVVAFNRSRAS